MAKYKQGFISNSSSEAFICSTSKGLDQIKQELELILDTYNKVTGGYPYFLKMYLIILNMVLKKNYKQYQSYDNYLDPNKVIGKLIIESASDNTIPYALFEFINDAFGVQSIHLG